MEPRGLTTSPLSLGAERGAALDCAVELLRAAMQSFDSPRPGQPPLTPESVQLLAQPLPGIGVGAVVALGEAAALLDQSLAQSRPRFFGYVGSSGLEVAVFADALAVAHDVNLASGAAAATLVEQQVISWVGDFVGFGSAVGAISSGGMVSNLTALAAAREHALPGSRRTGADGRGRLYCSAEAHSSIERAVELLGLGSASLRCVRLDAHRRMDTVALDELISADVAAGLVPIAVVATAGTTLTGAVDPLAAIADVCAAHRVWLHVDGAYGLPAAAAPSTAALFAGLDRADSATVDAHKWLFVPKACGVLLVRDRAALRAAFGHSAAYMIDELENPVDETLEYSRPFRALKLWAAFRAHGAAAFRSAIEANIELAKRLAATVNIHPRLELLVEPQLSIVAFRVLADVADLNAHNQAVVAALQHQGDVYVTSAVVDGIACLRPCFTNFRTVAADVDDLVNKVLTTSAALVRATPNLRP